MGGSPGELNEELVTQEKQKKGWRMNCDMREATEGLENELGYRLDDPGVGGGGDFSSLLRVQTGPGVHSTFYKMSTGEFPRG